MLTYSRDTRERKKWKIDTNLRTKIRKVINKTEEETKTETEERMSEPTAPPYNKTLKGQSVSVQDLKWFSKPWLGNWKEMKDIHRVIKNSGGNL